MKRYVNRGIEVWDTSEQRAVCVASSRVDAEDLCDALNQRVIFETPIEPQLDFMWNKSVYNTLKQLQLGIPYGLPPTRYGTPILVGAITIARFAVSRKIRS